MPERKYQESPEEWEERERQESVRAEPDWNDIEVSKAWLEERYPLLEDVSLGSPLFRYAKACVKVPLQSRGRAPIFLASMLSFYEMMRYGLETTLTIGFDPKQEKLYPDYGFPNQDRVQEPNWSDKDASRTWLEQRYPLGPASIGSPLYQYMQECKEFRYFGHSSATNLGRMLTNSEWERFCLPGPNSTRHRHRGNPNPAVLYPEYDSRVWPAPGPQPTDRPPFFPGFPRIKSPPPPAANPSGFAEFHLPHLKRQSLSSSPSNKRKSEDGDDAPPEYPANKRRRNPSDLSGGVLTSAKPRNPYEKEYDGPKQENDTGSMPPPARPKPNAASVNSDPSAMSLGQQRNNEEVGSSGRQDIVNMTGPPQRPATRFVEARKDLRVLNLERQSTEKPTAVHERQNDRSMETPKTGGPVQKSPVATDTPTHAHNGPMFTKTESQHDQETYLEEGVETGGLGHQPHGPHTNGRTVQNDNNAAHESANKDISPSGPDPKRENQAPIEENPDAMDIDPEDIAYQTSTSPTKTPPADPSRKRRIDEVEDEQPANSPSKKRRASPGAVGDDSLISGPPSKTSLAEFSRKSSIEGVEDAPPATSSPKRKRTPREFNGKDLASSSPFDPSERSTPTPFTRSEKPLRQESPSYEDPTTVVFRSNVTKWPALQSGSQSEATDGRRNPEASITDDQPTADLRDHDAALNGSSETQEPGNDGLGPPEPDSQGERPVHPEEDPNDMIIDFENPRDQTTINVVHDSGDRTKQAAIAVVIPLQIPQGQPAADQELSPDEGTMNVPVIQRKRKGGRKPGTKSRKAPQSVPQLEQGKRKPPTKGRKNRQSKPEREQQAYVGRLRSGVGERKHKMPSKYFMPP